MVSGRHLETSKCCNMTSRQNQNLGRNVTGPTHVLNLSSKLNKEGEPVPPTNVGTSSRLAILTPRMHHRYS